MSRSTATASRLLHAFVADDALFVLSKETRRLEPLSLIRALHANDLEQAADDLNVVAPSAPLEEEEPRSQEVTLIVTPEQNLCLLARAFTSSDDQVTLVAPAPAVPVDLPSPLGNETDESTAFARAANVPLAFADLPDLMWALSTPWIAPTDVGASPAPALTVTPPQTFGIRKSVSPHVAQAAREAREAIRNARAVKARTRLLVLGIWGTAVMLCAVLAFFATSS